MKTRFKKTWLLEIILVLTIIWIFQPLVAEKEVAGTFWTFSTPNYNVKYKTIYNYCYYSPTETCNFYFNKNGAFLTGITTGGSYGITYVLGAVYKGNWVLANDYPSGSGSPVETVFYWGVGKDLNYQYLDSSGVNGTGKLAPCTTSAEENFLFPDPCLLDKGKTICLEDQWGNQYNLTITGGIYLSGTTNHTSCGTCDITGFIMGKAFSFYVNIPTGTSSCMEGYLIIGDIKTKTGLWHNTNDPATGTIILSKCSPSPTGIPAQPGPGEKQ